MLLTFAEDIHWCIANERVVLLDLKRDAYSCLPDEADSAFRKHLRGFSLDADEKQVLDDLQAQGILRLQATAVSARPTNTAKRSLVEMANFDRSSQSSWRAIADQIWMGVLLKIWSLDRIVAWLRSGQHKHTLGGRALSPALELDIARFMASRRLLSRQVQCLRTSLALAVYLSRRRYYPKLVIGVRMKPFAAHAWVQDDDMILNDTLDEVAPFTPILVI